MLPQPSIRMFVIPAGSPQDPLGPIAALALVVGRISHRRANHFAGGRDLAAAWRQVVTSMTWMPPPDWRLSPVVASI